jgi:hypothetical protein
MATQERMREATGPSNDVPVAARRAANPEKQA